MGKEIVSYKDYIFTDVTDNPSLWENKDPVRPDLSSTFRSSHGRRVYALVSRNRIYVAFLCLARTSDVPEDERTLEALSCKNGVIAVPYTVWSYKAGAGKEIVSRVKELADKDPTIKRVVTLSPLTKMARRFHLKNNAKEYRVNNATVNFEY